MILQVRTIIINQKLKIIAILNLEQVSKAVFYGRVLLNDGAESLIIFENHVSKRKKNLTYAINLVNFQASKLMVIIEAQILP